MPASGLVVANQRYGTTAHQPLGQLLADQFGPARTTAYTGQNFWSLCS
jgi:hypothetical protein